MKRLNLVFPFLLFALTTFVFACGSGTPEGVSLDGPEYTSAYICPMHCQGSGSDKAGTCPVCHMDLEANKDAKASGETQQEKKGHEGHDHDNHEGHNH